MRRRGLVVLGLLFATCAAVPVDASSETARFGRLGTVVVTRPRAPPASVALLLSDGPPGSGRGAELASVLAEHGALVLGVDARAYLRALERESGCAYPAGDLEALSQGFQQHAGLPEYLHPTLVGVGAGAGLADAALAQAPAGTFTGAVGMDVHPAKSLSVTFCAGPGREHGHTSGQQLVPARTLPQLLSAYDAASVPAPLPSTASDAVKDLPLVEVAAKTQGSDTLAFIVTGDGGMAALDRALATSFSDAGIPVVALDSLRYFWKRRTPEETAADVARALRHYLPAWGRQRVLLVGYSRGADLVPAIAARLPPELRERLRLVALIAPGQEAEFEVHVTDLFGIGKHPSLPVLPDVEALGDTPLLCVYGAKEASESLCPKLPPRPGWRVVARKGGHHFDGDFEALARLVLQSLP
ncbi:AcvB/VirJ family lysyl-phosphatidylglycerol hydrolase [Pyxidicoccus sp. MSG2]|uniref:AcvB/VirJ family lysyl-phosphatidylglycerol hydrolase n=1 Tax=Pyxidicoccus sp. MSG2 TaxID=2996790 RepID=UPI00226F19D2|nr:AcvB/VirJ family lysyl-phosphatidylglycerol hydrolase [Pyxidicoccus sp. MSG2]MCY1016956.1 virulence factor family protein [Pyxidicoccus sp. MSG2]